MQMGKLRPRIGRHLPQPPGVFVTLFLLCCLVALACQQTLSKSSKCFNTPSFTWAMGWHRSSVQGRWGQRPGSPLGARLMASGLSSCSFGRTCNFSFYFLCGEGVIQFIQGCLLDAFVMDENLLQATCTKETPRCLFPSIINSGSEFLHLGELAPPGAT